MILVREFHSEKTTFVLVALAVSLALTLAALVELDINRVISDYPWGILVFFVSMEMFTRHVVRTGIMDKVAVQLGSLSKGNIVTAMALFSTLLFLVSAFLNNLTAMLVVLPVLFVLLRSMRLSAPVLASFFALMLAISNLGGAATPIGDFPAIIIMKSGMVEFLPYLYLAFPFFLVNATLITGIHLLRSRAHRVPQKESLGLGAHFLAIQHRYLKVNRINLGRVSTMFLVLFLAWSTLPADRFPPELVALAGVAFTSMLLLSSKKLAVFQDIDFKPILAIGSFLLIAGVINEVGWLHKAAAFLMDHIQDPTLLVVATMVLTALMSGLLSAGPTTAAMMPVYLILAEGPLADQGHWLAIAFASSICAGSSLFMWSATAGFLLSSKIYEASLESGQGDAFSWGVSSYLGWGILHFFVQLSLGVLYVLIGINWG